MLFDFASYLSRLDPSQSYTVKQLTGGLVNVTVRAVKCAKSSADGGRFPDHQSIVLKYAPPFVAVLGEAAPFSQYRQSVEAAALSFFTPPDGPLESICQHSVVLVPHCLYHDHDSHVLILSDLGYLSTLSEHLCMQTIHSGDELSSYHEIGDRLGCFFAGLHSTHSLQAIGSKAVQNLRNPDMRDAVYKVAVAPIQGYLRQLDIPDASQLYRRVELDFLREDSAEEQAFVVGDLWPGGVLLGNSDGPDKVIGIIDFEFSGPGRGLNGDMAQLFAHLHLHLLGFSEGSPAHEATKALIASIGSTYRRECRTFGSPWALPASEAGESPLPVLSSSSASTHVLRSAFLLHGREMINNAFEREWISEANEHEKQALRAKMVNEGVWYLRTAGDNEAEFVEDSNWKQVCAEKDEVVIGLLLPPHNEYQS